MATPFQALSPPTPAFSPLIPCIVRDTIMSISQKGGKTQTGNGNLPHASAQVITQIPASNRSPSSKPQRQEQCLAHSRHSTTPLLNREIKGQPSPRTASCLAPHLSATSTSTAPAAEQTHHKGSCPSGQVGTLRTETVGHTPLCPCWHLRGDQGCA